MKLGTNTTEIKFVHWIRLRERRYYDTFLENNMVNMKNPGKESMNFYINGKKLRSHICTMVRAETERYKIVRFWRVTTKSLASGTGS